MGDKVQGIPLTITHGHHPILSFMLISIVWFVLRYMLFKSEAMFEGFFLVIVALCLLTLFFISAKSEFSHALFYSLVMVIIMYLFYLAFINTEVINLGVLFSTGA